MKTENFDDAIKRKIEGINPRISDKDVNRVHKYVNANLGPFWYRMPFRRVLVYSSLALVLSTGFITWKITKLQDHKILEQTVENLTKKSTPKDVQTTINTKTTEISPNQKSLINSNSINPSALSTQEQKTYDKKPTSNFKNIGIRIANKPGESQAGYIQGSVNENSFVADKLNQKTAEQTDKNTLLVHNNSGENGGTTSKVIDNQENNSISKKNAENNILADQGKRTDSATKIPEQKPSENAEKNMNPNAPLTYRGARSDKKPHQSLNLHVQAGIGALLGPYQTGANLFAEILLNNRIGFNTGIKLLNVSSQKFQDDDDFNSKSGKDFDGSQLHEHHDHYNPPQMKYSAIAVEDKLIQVPLAFSYYFPIGKDFAVSISAGTDLDIYSRQNLSFSATDQLRQGAVVTEQMQNTNKTVLFNNLLFSVGVLKQWNHFALQLSPYISNQLASVDYKLQNNYYGANLKVLCSFGKGGF